MADVSVIMFGAPDQKGRVDGPFYLTNTAGWSAVISWVSSVADRFPILYKLTEFGTVTNTVGLANDLIDACESSPEDVANVLNELASRVGVGDEEETASIVGDEESERSEPVENTFDPNQPRNEKGQWTNSGEVEIHDPKSGEVFWRGSREEGEQLLREQTEDEPNHGLQLRPAQKSQEQAESEERAEREKSDRERSERIAEQHRISSLKTPHGVLPGHPDYVDPPERLYHATFAGNEIKRLGFKSSDELGSQTLGGSSGHLVSLTTKENAENYMGALHIAQKAASGKMTDADMINAAQQYGVSREQAESLLNSATGTEERRSFNFFQAVSLAGKQFPLFMGTNWSHTIRNSPPPSIVSIASKDVKDLYYNPSEKEWRVGDYKGVPVSNKSSIFLQKINGSIATLRMAINYAASGKVWLPHLQNAYRLGVERTYQEIQSTRNTVTSNESSIAFNAAKKQFTADVCNARGSPSLSNVLDNCRKRLRFIGNRLMTSAIDQCKTQQELDDVMNSVMRQVCAVGALGIVHAQSEGQLDAMEGLGVRNVKAVHEGNDRCVIHNSKTYTIQSARNLLPRHELCRCAWKSADKPSSNRR